MRLVAINIILAISVLGCAPRKPVDPIAQAKYQADHARATQELKEQKEANRRCLAQGKQADACCTASGGSSFFHEGKPACQWSKDVAGGVIAGGATITDRAIQRP